MGEISVNFGALQQGHAGIAQTYSRLTGTLEELESNLSGMIQSWSGQAQEAYLANKQQWDQAAANLATVLNQIAGAVSDAHDNYRAAENTALGNWK
ncbi:MAG TPA: WXG100 family type VII secretion target [Jatrophihabitantaceae bacterium]|jgi:WXG100 family type VII secretion target